MKPEAADTLKTRPTLLSKVRRGDEDGWTRFYDLYQGVIRAAALGAGLSSEEAKDVVQDVMITVQNYISGFVPDEGRGRFRTWLRRIVHSRIADQYRKKQRNPLEKAAPQAVANHAETAFIHRIPDLNEVELDRLIDGKLEQAILARAREAAKDSVRMEDYQAYDLFEVRELTAREVAVSLGIPAVTVRVRAFRVRRVVAKKLRRIVRALDEPRGGGV